ncbi:MAG: isoleucine--tRNA ligase [Pirellulaceae bacterium]|nr:isoleucine--tRNA ligase [Pirellulaceae bacterium]
MFRPVANDVRFPELEKETLAFWKENAIYQRSLAQRRESPKFVFFEGPPTANGLPHPGHCLTRAMKDLFPRYKTMRGYYCERKAGWDTHGLPVEVEVCKELGIHSKEEIESYGVEPFIQQCQKSVWRYMKEWEQLTERLGFWVDLEEAYVTYHKSYVESVWWSLKTFFDRGLLYKGHKIVWWWPQGGTALSSGEVGQGYRNVADPSIYVKFPLLDEQNRPTNTSLLVWTTTPWTMPSNQFAAVSASFYYVKVYDEENDEYFIVAKALLETIAAKVKRELKVVEEFQGKELLGKCYQPPFDYYYSEKGGKEGLLKSGEKQVANWRILSADYITTDSGTGIVHIAPAFGEVDYELFVSEQALYQEGGPDLICAVGPDGRFNEQVSEWEGRFVKEADKDLTRALRERGVLFHNEQYLHDYPFCWRAQDDPLIQYPRESWFVKTTDFKEELLANNDKINWLPDHIKEGRFGNFLKSNIDWALSRERYWGTPLPIWVCQESGQMEAIASYQELLDKPGRTGTEVWEKAKAENPELPDDLMVHKPYIDEVTYDSPFVPGGRMKRVSEVIDCWYDSGAMPFAQWGYPHVGKEELLSQFPADFISEALDQTRGWFYSLLAISTLLFSKESRKGSEEEAVKDVVNAQLAEVLEKLDYPHPYKNCIVLGLMLAEWWESPDGQERFLVEEEARQKYGKKTQHKVGKMSKSLRNYRSPEEIFESYGADALRWYFMANQAPWNSILYSERAIKESIPEFILRLWNVYGFFVIYANIDQFSPESELLQDVGQLDPSVLQEAATYRPISERGELDRWILSELQRTVEIVVERMDAYDNYGAATQLTDFVDGLSNWYVRRSRDRFWQEDRESPDKRDAYWTLYECLVTVSKLVAPFTPFLAETIWQNLTSCFNREQAVTSIHLCDYPIANKEIVDVELSQQMKLMREITSLGRSARMNAKLKVRQPLAKVEVVLADPCWQDWLESHNALVMEELNVKEVEYSTEADRYISYLIQPNFKRLGPRVGKLMPKVKELLGKAEGGELLKELNTNGKITLSLEGQDFDFDADDIQVRLQAKEGWAAAQGNACVVILSTELTPELKREGYMRDLVRLIQDRRKELGCDFTDRIEIGAKTEDAELKIAIEENRQYIQKETLADDIHFESLGDCPSTEHQLAETALHLYVRNLTATTEVS